MHEEGHIHNFETQVVRKNLQVRISASSMFWIVTWLTRCWSWMKRKLPFFFGTINHRLDYGTLDGLRIPSQSSPCVAQSTSKCALSILWSAWCSMVCEILWKSPLASPWLGFMHPISRGEKAKALPWLSIILLNLFSSGNKKPSPPIRSFHRVSSVNRCPMPWFPLSDPNWCRAMGPP